MIPDLAFKRGAGKNQKVWSRLAVKEGRSVVAAVAEAVLFTTAALMVWGNGECSQTASLGGGSSTSPSLESLTLGQQGGSSIQMLCKDLFVTAVL